MSIPKSTRSEILDRVTCLYCFKILHWHFIGRLSCLRASENQDEKYHLIANAANKYYHLIEL